MAAALIKSFDPLVPEGDHDATVCAAAFSPDGTQLAVASGDGTIRIWATQNEQNAQHEQNVQNAQHQRLAPDGGVRSLAFGPNGLLAAAGTGRRVRLWNTSDWTPVVGLNADATAVYAMAFAQQSQPGQPSAMLATGSNKGTVQVWNTPSGDERWPQPGQTGTVWAVAFAPDGATLATAGVEGVVLWDTSTGHRRDPLTGQAAPAAQPAQATPLRSVAFSPDGATLAAGGDDGTVRVWDAVSGELRYRLPGRASPVRAVAFDPQSQLLAAGDDAGTVRVWDLRTGELGLRAAGRIGQVWSLAYREDGIHAAVGRERDIRLWRPDFRRRKVWRRTLTWPQALAPIPGVFDWYKKNAAAGTLFLGVFLVVKGYVIAKGDLSTALGILQYAGLASVVIAGLLSALPILFAAMLAFTVYRMILPVRLNGLADSRRGLHLPAFPLIVVMIAAALLSAVFTPWTFIAGAVAIGLLAGVGRQLLDSPKLIWRRTRTWLVWTIVPILIVGSVGAVVAMLYTVWVPHEIVTFTPGPKGQPPAQEVGYVLSEDDGWITILTSGSRQIVRFNDTATKAFQVCERVPHGSWSDVANAATLWQELTRPSFLRAVHAAGNPKCP